MPPPEPTRVRRQLCAELAHLRALSGLALRPFGDLADMAHARVRRVERLEVLPNLAEVRGWLRAAEVDDHATVERILGLTEAAHVETAPWADLLAASTDRHLNALAAAREEAATVNCSYQQFIIPGLAQTATYARALLPHLPVDVAPEAHLAAQMNRQELLCQGDREFRFVLTRRAVTWNPDPARVSMTQQWDRLRELDRLPAVSVRVLEDDARPMGGYSSFTLYDGQPDGDAFVAIELERHTTTITDAAEVQHYRKRFAELTSGATPFGELATGGPSIGRAT